MINITFLGTTSGVPTRARNLPSVFLRYGKERILFDCGEGTQRQLMIKNLKFMKITRIFISHWHADHFAGLLGLVQTMELEGRREPLFIYGPHKTNEFFEQYISVGYFDHDFEISVKTLDEGDVVKCDGYKVMPFRVEHGIPALGYVFHEDEKVRADMKKAAAFGLSTSPKIGKLKAGKEVVHNGKTIKPSDVLVRSPGKKIVYTGDTRQTSNIVKFSEGADLLISDSTFSADFEKKARGFNHMTSAQAAEVAKKANVKKLVLTHISRRYQETKGGEKKLLDDAKKIFKNTVLAEDFMEIELK